MSDQTGWGGTNDVGAEVFGRPMHREPEAEFTDVEVLRAIGKELKAIKVWVALTAIFAAITVHRAVAAGDHHDRVQAARIQPVLTPGREEGRHPKAAAIRVKLRF